MALESNDVEGVWIELVQLDGEDDDSFSDDARASTTSVFDSEIKDVIINEDNSLQLVSEPIVSISSVKSASRKRSRNNNTNCNSNSNSNSHSNDDISTGSPPARKRRRIGQNGAKNNDKSLVSWSLMETVEVCTLCVLYRQ